MIHLSSFEMPNKKYVLPFLLLYNLCAPLHDLSGMYGSAWKLIEIRFIKFSILLICKSEPFPFFIFYFVLFFFLCLVILCRSFLLFCLILMKISNVNRFYI